jgi:hypothetical protein
VPPRRACVRDATKVQSSLTFKITSTRRTTHHAFRQNSGYADNAGATSAPALSASVLSRERLGATRAVPASAVMLQGLHHGNRVSGRDTGSAHRTGAGSAEAGPKEPVVLQADGGLDIAR